MSTPRALAVLVAGIIATLTSPPTADARQAAAAPAGQAQHSQVQQVQAEPALAEESPTVLYLAYEAAVEGGRLEDAARYALAAWHRGEQVWGPDNPNTAALAFNAGFSALRVWQSGPEARHAARVARARATPEGPYQLDEAAFVEAALDLHAVSLERMQRPRPATRTQTDQIVAAVERVSETARPLESVASGSDGTLASALELAANEALELGAWRQGEELAARALAVRAASEPDQPARQALASFLRSVARAQLRDREGSLADSAQAVELVGIRTGQNSALWGRVFAWDALLRGTTRTPSTGSVPQDAASRPLQRNQALASRLREHPECEPYLGPAAIRPVEEIARRMVIELGRAWMSAPEVQTRLRRGSIGLALIADFYLSADGVPERVDYLGTTEGPWLYQRAERHLMRYRFRVAPDVPAACRVYRMTITFETR